MNKENRQLLILDRQFNVKKLGIVSTVPTIFDTISPQKTTLELLKDESVDIGNIISIKKYDTQEFLGIVQDVSVKNKTELYVYPFINAFNCECTMESISGSVYDWIVATMEANFVNIVDDSLKLNLEFRNMMTLQPSLSYIFSDGNLFEALKKIFYITGVYLEFSLKFVNGIATAIYCDVYNTNDYPLITVRYDNPLLGEEKPVIENSMNYGTNKIILKPEEGASGNTYAFYLLEDNTVTTNQGASGRLTPVNQKIARYAEGTSSEELQLIAEKELLGEAYDHNIYFKIIKNDSYQFALYRKVKFITEDRTYVSYCSKIDKTQDNVLGITLGVIRNNLTDKVKELEAQTSSLSSATSAGSGAIIPVLNWGNIGGSINNQADLRNALAGKIPTTEKGAVNGVATLGADGKLTSTQMPAIRVTDVYVVASQAEMLALEADEGDVAKRTDLGKSYILSNDLPSILSSWLPMTDDYEPIGAVSTHNLSETAHSTLFGGKVDKIEGKGLSTNDLTGELKTAYDGAVTDKHTHSNKAVLDSTTASYTTAEATKLSGIDANAEVNVIETVKVNGTALTPTAKAVDVIIDAYTKSQSDSRYYLKNSWSTKTWNGLTSFTGQSVWTDGTNYYYSFGTTQYVLDVATSTWSSKTWTGLTDFAGVDIWTDGVNIYYSDGTTQYVLDIGTSTWSTKTWTGLTDFSGGQIWTDGVNIYYSFGTSQYVLDVATSTWSSKTWTGLTDFSGGQIWTDGVNIYYSFDISQYVLDIGTSTWSTKTWNELTGLIGQFIWTDGTNYYYSFGTSQYVLDVATSTWSSKTWTGLTSFNGSSIWTDGTNYYYSSGSSQYVLSHLVATLTGAETLTNKTLTDPIIARIKNGSYYLSIPTLTADDTIVTLNSTQILTNKTLTAPQISTISNTGTLTLPTTTGTLALTSQIPSVSDFLVASNIKAGTNITLSVSGKDVTINSTAGGDGTVTSVGVANSTNGGLSVSGSPITTAGTISVGHTNILASAQTTQAIYPIKIDKNGHISEYGTAVVIPDGVTVVDNLTSTSTTSALSANQGKVLNDNKVPNTRTVAGKALSANITLASTDLTDTANIATVSQLATKAVQPYIQRSYSGGNGIRLIGTYNYSTSVGDTRPLFYMAGKQGHGNGTSYLWQGEFIFGVSTTGVVTAKAILKVSDGTFGTFYYRHDTANKILYLYIYTGQYSSAYFSDLIQINAGNYSSYFTLSPAGSVTTDTIVEGVNILYPASGGTIALTSQLPTLSSLGVTATAAELNHLDGITATVAELNYTGGVTSAIQTQLNGKANKDASNITASVWKTALSLDNVQNYKIVNGIMAKSSSNPYSISTGLTTIYGFYTQIVNNTTNTFGEIILVHSISGGTVYCSQRNSGTGNIQQCQHYWTAIGV